MQEFAFVMDQQVGLRTQAINFERVVSSDSSVTAKWVPVRYENGGLLSRIPGLPSSIKGTMRGISEIRNGLGDARKYDGVLWATWAAKSVHDLVSASPAFMLMDMTPKQMEEMGHHYGYTSKRAKFMGGWKHRATEKIYQEAKHIFPWNKWVAKSLIEDYGVPAEKITPVSPGVDVNLYSPNPAAKKNDGVVRVLFVGGDFLRKGGDLLLRWMSEISEDVKVELHIVTRDEVVPQAGVVVHKNLGNNSAELVNLYQMCDVFALPTRADCYSLVSLEALAAGMPVVVTKMGGIPEIFAGTNTGRLIEAEDYDALKANLDELVTNHELRTQMGVEARKTAVDRFDREKNLQLVLGIMKSLGEKHAYAA